MHSCFEIARLLGVPEDNVALVGSRLICRQGNDWDFLVLMSWQTCADVLEPLGFEPELNDQLYDSIFQSWRKDDINLIVVGDRGVFLAEYATALAAMFVQQSWGQLNTRERRVDFHGGVRNFLHEKLGARV